MSNIQKYFKNPWYLKEHFVNHLMEDFVEHHGDPTSGAEEAHQKRVDTLTKLEEDWAPYEKRIDKFIHDMVMESGDLPQIIEKLQATTKESCPHPIDQLEYRSRYREGGYDYAEVTTHYVKCVSCGVEKIMDQD